MLPTGWLYTSTGISHLEIVHGKRLQQIFLLLLELSIQLNETTWASDIDSVCFQVM